MALRWYATAPIHFDLVRAFNVGDLVPDSIVAAHPAETTGRVTQIDVPAQNPGTVLRPLLTSDRDTDPEREAFVPARLSDASLRAASVAAVAEDIGVPATAVRTAIEARIAASDTGVKRRTRRQIERATTGPVRRCALPAGFGWNPDIPVLTDGARYWSPFDVAALRPPGGVTYYVMPSWGASSGSGLELGTLTAPLDAGVSATALAITASAQAASSGAKLALIVGTAVIPVAASAAVAAGATSVSITAVTPGIRVPAGSKLVAVRDRVHDKFATATAGDTFTLLDQVNPGTTMQGLVIDKSINLVGLKPNTVVTMTGAPLTWTLAVGMAKTYQAARTNVRNVVDFQADPDGVEYLRVSSVAEVEATPGSWYQATDGTGLLSVRTLQGGMPDNNIHHALITFSQLKVSAGGGATIYMENLRLVGGVAGFIAECTDTTTRSRLVMKDCAALWGGYGNVGATLASLSSTMKVNGNIDFYAQRLTVAHGTEDGLAYTAVIVSSTNYAPRAVEIDCHMHNCGVDSIFSALRTGWSQNVSTGHNGSLIVSVGGRYHHSSGTPIADVHVGTKRVLFGVDAWGSTSGYALFNAAIAAQQAGAELWLYGCRAWGTLTDLYCIEGATMHVLDNTEYDTSAGTFALVA